MKILRSVGALENERFLIPNFMDVRSEEERKIQREAYAGISLGKKVDSLVDELTEIGKRYDYVSSPGREFNEYGHHKRTREIGEKLNRMGGKKLMQAVWYRILARLGPGKGRSLEFAWAHIGEWLP